MRPRQPRRVLRFLEAGLLPVAGTFKVRFSTGAAKKSMQNEPMTFAPADLPSPRRITAGVVLYLDLDGVVQHEAVMWHGRRGIYMSNEEAPGRKLFEWLPHLEDA
jgi:hypothetical protein